MKRLLPYIAIMLIVASCIKNDIPYPQIQGKFTAFEVEGQIGETSIDAVGQVVTVNVDETIDIRKVIVSSYSVNEEATVALAIGDTINLTDSVHYTLSTSQDYKWTVLGVQNIARRAVISGQIGTASFDVEHCKATIFVNENQDLANITVTEIKLGPSNATTLPNPTTVSNFLQPQTFSVKVHGNTQIWTVEVVQTSENARTYDAEPWAKFAILHGEYNISEPHTPYFEYRLEGASEWILLETNNTTLNGGVITDTLRGLTPETAYECRVIIGDFTANTVRFTTEAAPTLSNLSFNNWSRSGKVWNPWLENGEQIWSTGNKGVATFGESNTTPVDGENAVSGNAARLETVSVALVGLAAGNLFVGDFSLNILNPNASVKFGKPYTGRPTTLSGYYRYSPQIIDQPSSSEHAGEMDKCHVYIMLEDWEGATTRPSNPKQIAYGEFKSDQEVTTYMKFNIKLAYSNVVDRPTHIVIVSTSSHYGETYVGGIGSTLYVDEFELGFD